MLASGTVGYGPEYDGLIDFGRVGALITKTITLRPRAGNAPPRLAETPGGLLNAIGLENVGLRDFLEEKLPQTAALPVPVVASIAGATPSECAEVARRVSERGEVAAIELNISCPNVERSDRPVWADPEATRAYTRAARRAADSPLIVKLSPSVTDITIIAEAAESGGADAVTVANTLPGMRIDLTRMRPALGNVTGGLSGRALMPVNLALVWKVAARVSIPVIGCGGVASASDALEYLAAGAAAVQVGTAVFADPGAPTRIAGELAEHMKEMGFDRIEALVGIAREESDAWRVRAATD
jgi:dihydroorotate dehydrogenase (NAD+) catalytic subunit